jgi:hypothetical protein
MRLKSMTAVLRRNFAHGSPVDVPIGSTEEEALS